MKNNLQLFFLFVTLILCSCSKKNDEQPQPSSPKAADKQAYEKKWIVNSSSARVQGSTSTVEIRSVEFMLNTYVVIYTNDSTIAGSYTALNDQTLYLSNFGTLHISSLGNDQFDFILEQSGKANVTINSTPVSIISSTAKTHNLCNTWKLTKIISGDTLQIKNYDIEIEGEISNLALSEYGTYLNKSISFTGNIYSTGKWNWTDAAQTSITIVPDHSAIEVIGISFSNSNSILTFSGMQPGTSGPFPIVENYVIQ